MFLQYIYAQFSPIRADKSYLKEATRDQTEVQLIDRNSYYEISAVSKEYAAEPTTYYDETKIGFIFYPGGRIDSRAYAYKLKEIVENYPNVVVYVVKPFLNFAFFAVNAPDSIMTYETGITNWYIGGHSLGGAMACEYIAKSEKSITGLLLLASYCASTISSEKLNVLSLRGSNDAVLNSEKYDQSKSNLPQTAEHKVLQGANHAQWGNYGKQQGDGNADITDDEVLNYLIEEIGRFLYIK